MKTMMKMKTMASSSKTTHDANGRLGDNTTDKKKINITIKNTHNNLDELSDGLDSGPDPLSVWVFGSTAPTDAPTAAQPGACNGYTFKKCSSQSRCFGRPPGGWSSSSLRRDHTLHVAERVPKVFAESASLVTAPAAPGVQGNRHMMSRAAGIKLGRT
jgi:hypothetical protein